MYLVLPHREGPHNIEGLVQNGACLNRPKGKECCGRGAMRCPVAMGDFRTIPQYQTVATQPVLFFVQARGLVASRQSGFGGFVDF